MGRLIQPDPSSQLVRRRPTHRVRAALPRCPDNLLGDRRGTTQNSPLNPRRFTYTTPNQRQSVDPATVSAALRRVWATLEHKHAGLSRALYDQSRDENEPSSTTMVTHRTWAERCQDAGVPLGHPTWASEAYGGRGTTTQALAALTRYLEHCSDVGEHATVRGYDRFQREDPTLPSPKTVLARLLRGYDVSGWPGALQLALDRQASRGH